MRNCCAGFGRVARIAVIAAGAFASAPATVLLAQQTPAPAAISSSRDIDREIWAVIIDTVLKDDIVRMGATYLPDAVLVTPTGTQPIKTALDRWGRDMVANKAKGTHATVEFRFAQRLDGETTAFERGIFNYTTIDKDGKSTPGYYPFEELLITSGRKWRIVMERQFAAVTAADWAKLPAWTPGK